MSSGAPHETGRSGEQAVRAALTEQGWSVLAANFRAAGGEIDLVVERAGVLRFVEVKTRTPGPSALDPTGIESVNANKRRRLVAAANAWLDTRGLPAREAAFLVALVSTEADGEGIEWWDDPL